MREDRPSRTAFQVAVQRALHQRADRPVLFADPLAERILGEEGPVALERAAAEAERTAPLRTMLVLRSLVAETALAEAQPRGAGQYVLLGAGLDSFAYRNPFPDVAVYEVDHPATKSWKIGKLAEARIRVTPSVRHVAVDFRTDDLFERLAQAGFDETLPTVFAMLGVVLYVERTSLLATWEAIADRAAPGSELVFDYSEPFERAEPMVKAGYEGVARRAAEVGEPWITFFDPPSLHQDLRRLGFAAIEDLGQDDLNRRFLEDRSDSMRATPLGHVLRARKSSGGGENLTRANYRH